MVQRSTHLHGGGSSPRGRVCGHGGFSPAEARGAASVSGSAGLGYCPAPRADGVHPACAEERRSRGTIVLQLHKTQSKENSSLSLY